MSYQAPNGSSELLATSDVSFEFVDEKENIKINADVFFRILSDLHYCEGYIGGILEMSKLKAGE